MRFGHAAPVGRDELPAAKMAKFRTAAGASDSSHASGPGATRRNVATAVRRGVRPNLNALLSVLPDSRQARFMVSVKEEGKGGRKSKCLGTAQTAAQAALQEVLTAAVLGAQELTDGYTVASPYP